MKVFIAIENGRIAAAAADTHHARDQALDWLREGLEVRCVDGPVNINGPAPDGDDGRDQACRTFAARMLRDQMRHGFGDVDGAAMQEELAAAGLLRVVEATEPCDAADGEKSGSCNCAASGFPTECYRLTDAGKAALEGLDA